MPEPISRRRWWMLAACGLMLAIVGGAWWIVGSSPDPLRSPARQAWRDQAVGHVRERAADRAWIEQEIANRTNPPADHPGLPWIGSELLLMRNGEWIVFRNVCTKEQHPGIERDLFIGLGSDGQWYYSTFHFCKQMMVLQIEPQPASLADFAHAYWLAPFDGQSDQSLTETWTNQPYGDDNRANSSTIAR